MSIWGTGVFQSDIAQEIRDAYRGMLLDKVPDEEAAARIVADFAEELSHPDDGAMFVIALAVTMHKVGRLTEPILEHALAAIDAGPEPWWENEKDLAARARVFATTRELLKTEQPAPKRLSRPWEENTSLAPGDVLALNTDGGYGLLRVARLERTRFGAYPIVATLDYRGTTLPKPEQFESISDLVLDRVTFVEWPGRPTAPAGRWVTRLRKRDPDFRELGFELAGRVAPRPGDDALAGTGGADWEGTADMVRSGSWFRVGRVTWNHSPAPAGA